MRTLYDTCRYRLLSSRCGSRPHTGKHTIVELDHCTICRSGPSQPVADPDTTDWNTTPHCYEYWRYICKHYMYCTMRVLRTRSKDYRTVLYLGYWLLILLPWKTTAMAQAKEIVGCCGGDFNAEIRCGDGSVITVQSVVLARNQWCVAFWCCTTESNCETSAKDRLPDYYASIMECAGKSECLKQPPDKCPNIPGCSKSWQNKFIRIEYTCTLATTPPTTPGRETSMTADNTTKVSTVWPVTSFNHVTTASDLTPTMTMMTDGGKTNIGVWVGVAIAIGLSIVAVVVLIIYCTRRSRKQKGPAAASLANTNIEGETVRNDNVYMMENREPSPYDSAIAASDQSDYQYANYNGNPFSNSAPSSDKHNPQTADSYASYDTACAVDDAPSVGDVSYYATPRRYGNTEVAKSGPPRDERGAQRETTTSGREGGAEVEYSADPTDPESEDEALYDLKLQENELYQSN